MKMVVALLFTIAAQIAWSANCSSISNGNWNNGGTWSCGAGPGAGDDVTINSLHTVNANGNRSARSLVVNAGGTLALGGSTVTIVGGGGAVDIDGNVTATGAGRLVKNSTGTLSGAGTLTNLNDLTIAGATTIAAGTSLTFTGAECQIIANASITNNGTLTFNTAACGTSRVINIAAGVTFANNGTVVTGTVAGSNVTTSVWTNAANSTLEVTAALLGTGILNASANGNLVRYNANANQAIKLPSGGNYYDLRLSGGNTKTPAAGTYNILHDFTIDSGVTCNVTTSDPTINVTGAMSVAGTYTGSNTAALSVAGGLTVTGTYTGSGGPLTLTGDFTQSGTFTSGAGVVTFSGGTAQTFGGTAASTITSLTINKSAGTDVTMANATPSPTITGTLTLTSGQLITAGANCAASTPIILGTAAALAGGSAASYVVGALRKNFLAGATLNFRPAGLDEFPVGTASAYSPIEISAGTTSTAGTMTVCVTATDHPSMTEANGGGIDVAQSVNRYWSVSTTTINTSAVRMDATFKFVAGDVDAGATTGNFIIQRWDNSDWNPTSTVTAGATSTRVSNVDISSTVNEFQIGEPLGSFPSVLGAFNAFDTTAPAGGIVWMIGTKQVGTSFSVRLVRIANNAINTAYSQNGVTVELYDAADNSGAFTNGCRSSWAAIAGTSQTVNFVNGVATAIFNAARVPNVYRDVRIHIERNGGGAGEGCSSDRFAIRPTSITVAASDLNWQQAYTGTGTVRALSTTSTTGGAVHAASDPATATPRPFTLTATAEAAGSQSASRYDGNPIVVSGFPVCTAALQAGCVTGVLSFTGASWTGTGTRSNATAHYTEAGFFDLQLEDATFSSVDASDGTPLATRRVPATATGTMGRFVPDHFDLSTVNTPSLRTFNAAEASCNAGVSSPRRSFTYIGQGFGYATAPAPRVTAKNAAGTTTQNYKGALFRFSGATSTTKSCTTGPDVCTFTTTWANGGSLVETYTYALTPASTPGWDGSAATVATLAASDNADGTGDISYSGGLLAFTRNVTTPKAPFTASITNVVSLQDSAESGTATNGVMTSASAAAYNNIAFDSGNEFRYGLVRLTDVFGPLGGNASGNAPVGIEALYWNGATFARNTVDNCSSFIEKNFVLYGHGGAVNATNLATPTAGSNGRVSMDGGSPALMASGLARVNVLAPSPAITAPGSAKICLDLDGGGECSAPTPAAKSYLQGNWRGASYTFDPEARVGFGLFGSQPKNFIFFRENY